MAMYRIVHRKVVDVVSEAAVNMSPITTIKSRSNPEWIKKQSIIIIIIIIIIINNNNNRELHGGCLTEVDQRAVREKNVYDRMLVAWLKWTRGQ